MDFVNKMFRGDRAIWTIFAILCLISIMEVYSASSTLTFKTDTNYWEPIMRHTMFLLTGLLIVLAVHAIKPRYFIVLRVLLPVALALLIFTRITGTKINESYRWVDIFGIRFQPSEIAKLCLIVTTAFILSKRKDGPKDKSFQRICLLTGATCLIILLDNVSTALLLGGIIFLMMFVGQIRLDKEIWKFILNLIEGFLFCILYFIPDEKLTTNFPKLLEWKVRFKKGLNTFLVCFGIVAIVFCLDRFVPEVNKLFSRSATVESRLDNFGSEVDVRREDFKITDDNFQSAHACIAIANGKIGRGPGNSRERDILPQAYSDFIYAIIIEEMGVFIGGIGVILLYLILFIRAGRIADRCDKPFPKLLVMGVAMILVIQAISNMAVAVHLIPVTGQPMPLVSRGGTSTWINCIYIGIILSVSRYENPKGAKREDEIVKELEEEALASENVEIETQEIEEA